MGIKGLRSFLRKRDVRGDAEHIPRGAMLIVDGYSLLHHVLQSHGIDRLQISYAAIDAAVRQTVQDLEAQGFASLVVYMDGSQQVSFKGMERGARSAEQSDQWYLTYHAVIEGHHAGPMKELVMPPLASAQFVYTVRACGADVRFCAGEADQEIARCCSALSADGAVYCYSRDSDFLVMRDVAYIELDSLVVDGSTTVAEVWRRENTAAQLGMTEEQLVELAILIGNDYTFHLDRSVLLDGAVLDAEDEDVAEVEEGEGDGAREGDNDDDVLTPVGEAAPRPLSNLYHAHRFISEHPQGSAFRLSAPRNQALEDAMAYSRALYDLRDPPAASVSLVASEDGGVKKDGGAAAEELQGVRAYTLSPQEVRAVDDWRRRLQVRAVAGAPDVWASPGDVGRRVLDYLQTIPAAPGAAAVYKGISASHVRAFARMLDALQTQHAQRHVHMLKGLAARLAQYEGVGPAVTDAGTGIGAAPGQRPVLRWTDFLAANWYQLLCRCMLYGRKEDFHLQNAACIFDGELFFRFVAEEEQGQDGANGAASHLAPVPAILAAATAVPSTVEPGNLLPSTSTPLLTLLQQAADKTAAAAAAAMPAAATHAPVPRDTTTPTPAPTPAPAPTSADVLPIDAHRDEILQHVGRDRVTIIHGETGCGKSSRLPLMLLEQAEATGAQCRMMISQPRRIAASSLMKRLRSMPGVGDKVGLRMGHGVRDETDGTVISFVTTGYLVRLVAHSPQAFRHHTHLIVDEVHERSIDGDLLCLLARRLLATHRHLKLVLMSATMHTALYKQYFFEYNLPREISCLSVGVRRFPVAIKYLEDVLAEAKQSLAPLPSTLVRTINGLIETTKSATGTQADDVKQDLAKSQYEAVVYLVRSVGQVGKAVLVFVSGMQDIEKLYEQFEGKARYRLFAIHSEVAFEEQEQAFAPAAPDEIKVIIATNAAESSITLPDCDCVICLGSHKALRYDAAMHRVTLVNTWISKASATQRAGRTGRVRPGTVYRLYSKALFEKFQEHEESEVRRRTLQDVLLRLWTMLESSEAFDGVVPVLEALPEPPDMDNVDLSFHTLYHTGMITAAHNDGALTSLGRFAGSLPVDMQLGQLICYGIALGVGTEAVVMAAALSQPQVAYRRASPFIHTDPDEFNGIIRTSFLTATQLDGGAYSEPIMGLNLFCKWMSMAHSSKAQHDWAVRAGLSHVRVSQFTSSAMSLVRTTRDAMRHAGGPAAGKKKGGGGGGRKSKAVGKKGGKEKKKAGRADGEEDVDVGEEEDVDDDGDGGEEEEEEAPVINVDALLERSEPWPASVLNRLRLLLAWTCDGNVMYKPKPSNIPKQDFHTAHISCPSLTQAQAASLLPVSKLPALGLPSDIALDDAVSWHLQSGGRRIYDARLGSKRAASNLEELLKDLVAAASNGLRQGAAEVVSIYVTDGDRLISSPVAPVVWFVQQPQRGRDDDGVMVILALPTRGTDSLALNVYYRIVLSIFMDRLVGVGGFDFDLPAAEGGGEDEGEKESDGEEGGGADVNGGVEAVEQGGVGSARQRFEMYHVAAASKRELLLLAKLHDTFPVSVSMLAPSIGNAKVMANNCLPTAGQLKRVFFGDRVDEQLHDDTETQVIALEESKGLRRVSEQVIGGQQAIVFADTPSQSAGAGAVAGARVGPRRLLDDVPLGMRILDSYRAAQRDGRLRVWRDEDQVAPAMPVGAAGARGHPNRGGLPIGSPGGTKGGAPVPEDVVLVTVRTVQSSWTSLPGLRMGQQQLDGDDDEGGGGHRDTPKMAVLTKHSVPAVAMHRGPHTLYAVAFSCLVVGHGKKMVVCGGVTVCPPGWHWLFLALTVLGCDAAPILHHESKGRYLLPGGAGGLRSEYSDAELQAMAAATELIAALPNRDHIARDDALITALDHAFARWIAD